MFQILQEKFKKKIPLVKNNYYNNISLPCIIYHPTKRINGHLTSPTFIQHLYLNLL